MAIHPTSPPPQGAPRRFPAGAASSPPLQAQFLPPHITIDQVTSTFVTSTLSIPLDIPSPDDLRRQRSTPGAPGLVLPQLSSPEKAPNPPRTPIRRDSLRQREALLKGTPGSRRRQRWENDRLLSNPYVIPPTPADFLPTPTHPTKTVHYDLACLWDAQYRQQSIAKHDMEVKERRERTESQIPKELKAGLKKARGAVGMVRMLEERVREFVEKARDAAAQAMSTTDTAALTHEDGREVVEHGHGVAIEEPDEEVIVFMPKKHKAAAATTATTTTNTTTSTIALAPDVPHALPIYHSPPTDPSAPFIRWLVHSIAEYYGLHSWSVTEKAPPMVESAIPSRGNGKGEVRVAYVGLEPQKEVGKEQWKGKGKGKRTKSRGSGGGWVEGKKVDVAGKLKFAGKMPRPLWVML